MAEQQKDAEKAAADARAAEIKAQEAREKAEADERTTAEKRADKAGQAADDARAKAAEAQGGAPEGLKTAGEAGIVAPHVDPDTPAGDVLAVKRGNDPANPQPLPGIPADYDGPTVRLSRTSPDKPGEVITAEVHPDMEGDYLRAGWSR